MNLEKLSPAARLVEAMNRVYYGQMTTVSGGNLSLRDADGSIWITPTSIDKGSLTPEDICHVLPDGTVLGRHKPSVELPFHRHIYALRPDISAIVHAHPPALVGFSLARILPDVTLLPGIDEVVGKVRIAKYEVPGSQKLGEYIAAEFEKGGDAIMMENHGVVVGKPSLTEAFCAFEALDHLARVQVAAARLGQTRPAPAQSLKSAALPVLARTDAPTQKELALRGELCAFAARAYRQQLTSASYGEWSARLDENSFLITPARADRATLEPEDILLVRNGKAESAAPQEAAIAFHAAMYAAHPQAQAIAVARPVYVMAYAVTDAEFDARTIPESYIMLRFPLRLPFGAFTADPAGTAARFSPAKPVALAQNDSFAVMGTGLLNAFDRLEVGQYSAWSLLNCAAVGQAVKISAREVRQIEEDFHLPQ